jgi:hypothetical protein
MMKPLPSFLRIINGLALVTVSVFSLPFCKHLWMTIKKTCDYRFIDFRIIIPEGLH